jgi:fructose-bisphosphate aldolase class I
MTTSDLDSTISALLAPGRGILAADESFPTIEKRFKALGISSTEENRRVYREMLFTTSGLGEFISGAILFDETLRQKSAAGVPFVEALAKQGIVPGIKVDKGTTALANFAGEKITQGLDGLRERLVEYRKLGARFTKWRAVIAIGAGIPSRTCIGTNAQTLARFAALSQEAGLVPIVEPEILMDGDHSLARCEEVSGAALKSVFDALVDQRVALEHILLKTSMVLSGEKCPQQAGVAEVTEATLRCFRRFVPAAVPGIVFLSGGQSDTAATLRLNAICRAAGDRAPWTLSFSFGRALQAPALETWKGISGNLAAAQTALHHRARCNGFAVQGKYSEAMENDAGDRPQKR